MNTTTLLRPVVLALYSASSAERITEALGFIIELAVAELAAEVEAAESADER